MTAMRRKLFKTLGFVALLVFLGILAFFAWFYYPALKPVEPGAQVSITGGGLPPGCTCHSKNARFVSMHQLFSVEDCRKCHGKGEDLMGKKSAQMTAQRTAALEKRIKSEPICQECHRGKGIVVSKKSEISGRLYCPKEKKMYKKSEAIKRGGKYYCPKFGIELIDVDEVAVKSAKEPKNEYCIACHPIDRALNREHRKVVRSSGLTSIEDCLKCHTSHSQCGGCHF
jgi:nitrate/TMAO reductase-like tetraheme cytochrome c subunit